MRFFPPHKCGGFHRSDAETRLPPAAPYSYFYSC